MKNKLYELINQKKDLQKRIESYNSLNDKSFSKSNYISMQQTNFEKVQELRAELKQLKNRIDFIIEFKDYMGKKNEENNKSNRYK